MSKKDGIQTMEGYYQNLLSAGKKVRKKLGMGTAVIGGGVVAGNNPSSNKSGKGK